MANNTSKILNKRKVHINVESRLKKNQTAIYIISSLLGLSFYVISFFIFYFIKRNTVIVDQNYYKIILAILVSLISGTVLANKFKLHQKYELALIFRKIYIALIFSLGILSVSFLIMDISFASRFLLLGTFVLGALFETAYYLFLTERRKKGFLVEKTRLSFNYFVADGIILTIIVFIKILLPINNIHLNESYLAALVVLFVSWGFSGSITHRFNPIENAANKWHAFGLQGKFYLLNFFLIAISIYFLQISETDLKFFIECTLIYTGLSFTYFIYKFSEKITNKTDEPVVSILRAYEIKNTDNTTFADLGDEKYKLNPDTAHESNLRQELQNDYLREFPKIFSFIDRKIDLKSFNAKNSTIIRSLDSYNIKVLQGTSHEFIMNLHELNDFRRINEYIRLVNSKLVHGGIFIGCFIPNRNRHKRFLKKYSHIPGNVFYFFDFIWKRVVPKLPILRNFYLKITSGKDRAISLTEGLGRLVYCGFDILDITELNDMVFYAARKIKAPINISNLSYSIIFKMRRVGRNGKPIFVYKLRTMHPYSEFLQEFVYVNNKLEHGGKFKGDFRIPIWGKLIREMWIDELPMIFNWIKRDLKLIGVRPISRQYMNLYSKDHQTYREKFKPGLIPPFYADMPKTIEEIEDSESNYLRAYEIHPVKTDFIYFIKILNNILFKKKRSA